MGKRRRRFESLFWEYDNRDMEAFKMITDTDKIPFCGSNVGRALTILMHDIWNIWRKETPKWHDERQF